MGVGTRFPRRVARSGLEDLDPGRTPEDYPSEDVVSPWDAAIEDMEGSATEYADAGREPVHCTRAT